MSKKINVGNLILNIVVAIILLFSLLVAVNSLVSAQKGYVPFFGKTSVAVASPSMDGGDAFKKGDLIFLDLLDNEERQELQVGDVVTFYITINNKQELNTHRIVRYKYQDGTEGTEYRAGQTYGFFTKGDNNAREDTDMLAASNVIAKYTGVKIGGLGNVTLFINSSNGFLLCVVFPSLLIVGYCIYLVVSAVKEENKEKKAVETAQEIMQNDELRAQILAAEKEKMRQELLAEMQKGQTAGSDEAKQGEESAEKKN